MARRKKQVSPEDRLVGIRAHKKRDFYEGCNEPGKPWYTHDPAQFQKTFCKICRNEECIRAQGALTPWHQRMETQVEHLLNHPLFSDLATEDHKHLAEQAFNDISAKATRLEIARQRQDWEIPEAPTDGVDRVAATKATEDVDAAIKALAESRGQKPPNLPTPTGEEQPSHFSQEGNDPGGPDIPKSDDPVGVEYETTFPSSDGKTNYRIMLTTDGAWSCECKGFQHVRHCKHLDQVQPWYEEHKHDDELEQQAEAVPSPEPPPPSTSPPPPRPQPPAPAPAAFNTPMPHQGVMVGGDAVPSRAPSQLPPEPQDPWAPRKETIVEAGATVVMKTKKKE